MKHSKNRAIQEAITTLEMVEDWMELDWEGLSDLLRERVKKTLELLQKAVK